MKTTFFKSTLFIVASVALTASNAMSLPQLGSNYELNASDYWTVTSGTLTDNSVKHTVAAYDASHKDVLFLDDDRSGRNVKFEDAVTTGNKMAAVPEPATMLLLGAGLAGLAGFSRRKNREA